MPEAAAAPSTAVPLVASGARRRPRPVLVASDDVTALRVRRADPADDGDLAILSLLRWWWLAADSSSGGVTTDSGDLSAALSDPGALGRYQARLAAWWRPRRGAHLAVVAEELPDPLERGGVPVAVGMGWLSLTEPLPWELFAAPRSGLVHSVYVLPQTRGRGVARRVLAEIEAVGRAAGLDELVAPVDGTGSPVLLEAGFHTDPYVGLARRSLTGVSAPAVADVPRDGPISGAADAVGPGDGRAVAS